MNASAGTSLDLVTRRERWASVVLGGIALLWGIASGVLAASNMWSAQHDLDAFKITAVIVAALIAVPAALWIVRYPSQGVLLLTAVVYANLSEIGVRSLSLPSMFQSIVALLLLGLLIQTFRSGIDHIRIDALMFLGLLFSALIFVSSLSALDLALADERLVQALRGLALAFLVANLIRTPRNFDAVLWVIILAAAILATVTIVQVATGSYNWSFGGLARTKNAQIVQGVFEPRVSGPLSDPNFYAQILLVAVPMTLFRFWESRELIWRVATGTILMLINVAIVFTYSRGAMLAAALVYVISGIWMGIRARHLASLGLVAVLTVILLPGDAARRFDTLTQVFPWQERVEVIDTSFQERTMLMGTAVEMFADYPLLGVGAGNYTRNFDRYSPSVGSNISSYEGFDKRRFPHSLYLETAAELGIIGLFILIALMSTAVVYGLVAARSLAEAGRWSSSHSAGAVAISIIGYGITSLFLHGDYMQYLWLLIGLAIAAKHIAFENGRVKAVAEAS